MILGMRRYYHPGDPMASRPARQLNPNFSLCAPSLALWGGLTIVLSFVSIIFPAKVEASLYWKPVDAAERRLLEMEDKCVSQDKTDNINANAGDIKPAPVTTVYHSDKPGRAKGEADNQRVNIRPIRLDPLWLGYTALLAVLLARAILRIWH